MGYAVEHMHYFSEMAVAASRQGSHDQAKKLSKPFQYLELVVRDWPCFDDETFEDEAVCRAYNVRKQPPAGERWSVDLCEKQMQWHLDQHFGTDHVVAVLLFENYKFVYCFNLCLHLWNLIARSGLKFLHEVVN